MVACPNTVGQDFHPYVVVAVFEKFCPFRKALVRLKVFKNLLPLVLAPAVVQQIGFNKVHIQKGGQLCGILLCGVMLQRKGCCLFLRLFVRVITVDAEALACFGVIDSSAVVCKTVFLHRTGNIALCRGLRFFQRLIVQLIVKAVFSMVIGCNLIGRGHLRGISVNSFCGQPFRFFREGVIQLPHFFDLCVDTACPQMLFTPATSAKEVVTVSAQAVQQHIISAVIDKGRKLITSCLCGFFGCQA